MPRKTKEQKELENEKIVVENTSTKRSGTAKKGTTKSAKATEKKSTKTSSNDVLAKIEVSKKTTTRKKTVGKSVEKNSTTKASSAKKSTAKKTATKNSRSGAVKKEVATKKATSKKSVAKKTTAKKVTAKKSGKSKDIDKKVDIVEYYDLPYRYNQTVVKVLAQTPNNLFIYWDISDEDRENYKKQYGENFFDVSKPVLIVHNDTLGYSFEVEINDFANSWYLHINDSKCDYRIELGRRPWVRNDKINTDYIYVTTSNEIESPNDHILLNPRQKTVSYRNVKTNQTTEKPISDVISFLQNVCKFYDVNDISDIYRKIYKEEDIKDIFFGSNPSSGKGNPSSWSGNPSLY